MNKFKYTCIPIILLSFITVMGVGCSTKKMVSSISETVASSETAAPSSNLPLSIEIGFHLYSGIYDGEMKNGLPDGSGSFTTLEEDENRTSFTYTGLFKEGMFNGKGQIEYTDGSTLTGKFKANLPTGSCKYTTSYSTYYIVDFYKGRPHGLLSKYSAEDELISYDWFYKQELISDLMDMASLPKYAEFYHNTADLTNNVFKVQCTVSRILQTKTTCLLELVDVNNNIYLSEYKNTITARYDQAIIPSLKKGDTILLYGFFIGLDTLSTTDSEEAVTPMSYSYPKIEPVYAELADGNKFSLKDATYSYEEIAQNPYMYSWQNTKISGVVQEVLLISDSDTCVLKIRESSQDTVLNNNIYFVGVSLDDESTLPAPGDQLSVKGTLRGNYKLFKTDRPIIENKSSAYEFYPYIKATDFTIE